MDYNKEIKILVPSIVL